MSAHGSPPPTLTTSPRTCRSAPASCSVRSTARSRGRCRLRSLPTRSSGSTSIGAVGEIEFEQQGRTAPGYRHHHATVDARGVGSRRSRERRSVLNRGMHRSPARIHASRSRGVQAGASRDRRRGAAPAKIDLRRPMVRRRRRPSAPIARATAHDDAELGGQTPRVGRQRVRVARHDVNRRMRMYLQAAARPASRACADVAGQALEAARARRASNNFRNRLTTRQHRRASSSAGRGSAGAHRTSPATEREVGAPDREQPGAARCTSTRALRGDPSVVDRHSYGGWTWEPVISLARCAQRRAGCNRLENAPRRPVPGRGPERAQPGYGLSVPATSARRAGCARTRRSRSRAASFFSSFGRPAPRASRGTACSRR